MNSQENKKESKVETRLESIRANGETLAVGLGTVSRALEELVVRLVGKYALSESEECVERKQPDGMLEEIQSTSRENINRVEGIVQLIGILEQNL